MEGKRLELFQAGMKALGCKTKANIIGEDRPLTCDDIIALIKRAKLESQRAVDNAQRKMLEVERWCNDVADAYARGDLGKGFPNGSSVKSVKKCPWCPTIR